MGPKVKDADLEEADALLLSERHGGGRNSSDSLDDGGRDLESELARLEAEESLPPPVASGAPVREARAVKRIHPAPVIAIWITLSSSTILMNAYILNDLKFNFPISLTTIHLLYASLGTRILHRFTGLLDGLENVEMGWDRYLRNIVPIGALFSGSLIFSNVAYLSLSVSFIQSALKAFTSVAVLAMSVLMGLDQFNRRTLIIVVAISLGVALASYGEVDFDLGGFIFQALGIMFEATRLVAIQKLLQGMRMDPLVSLHYYAPVCATLNLLLIPIFEGSAPIHALLPRVGIPILVLNCTVAFLLNCSVVYLIGCASSLVLTLSGVLKDVLLVAGSVVLFGATVTGTQMIGYSIALAGLVAFKTPPEVWATYLAQLKHALGR